MKVQLNKLGDFNEVIDYYKQMLFIAENITPRNINVPSLQVYSPQIAYYRAVINNIGISVAQNFEILERRILKKEISEDSINESILFELENRGPVTKEKVNFFHILKTSFENIMKENNITPFQALKQIRNALLHGNYYLEINDQDLDDKKIFFIDYESDDKVLLRVDNNFIIHLKSNSMIGEIDFNVAGETLEYFYDTIRDAYADDNKVWYTTDRRFLSCKNIHFLQSFIDSFKAYSVRCSEKKGDNNIDDIREKYPFFGKMITQLQANTGKNHFEIKELSEEEINRRKEFLRNYINYIGKDKWQYIEKLPEYHIHLIFENIILRSSFDNFSNVTDINNTFCRAIYAAQINDVMQQPLNEYSRETFMTLGFESPIIYSNMLLGMINYAGLYLKAQNNDKDIPLFEYHNLTGFEGVEILIDTCDTKSIQQNLSGKEKQGRCDNYIGNLHNQLQSLKTRINRARKNKEKLSDKNPKRDELLGEYNKIIEENSMQIENIFKKMEQMKKRKEEYETNYTDYSEFFRHLRNSIAHGNYTIDYNKALHKKDLSKIEYTFIDYPEGEHEIPEFKVKLTANKLLKIINGIQTRVNTQLSNEAKIEQIANTDFIGLYFEEYHQIQENEKDRNSKRPKETGLSPDRIETGLCSVGHLEIGTKEQVK